MQFLYFYKRVRFKGTVQYQDGQRTKARVWLTPNTCFFANPGLLNDIDFVTLLFYEWMIKWIKPLIFLNIV